MSDQSSPTDAANPPLSSSFTPSSWSSNLGVAEALASYRRSQYIITGQNVASSIDTDEQRDEIDEESQYGTFEDEESPASFTGDREEELFVDGLEQEGDWRAPESWRVTDTLGQRPQAPELSRQTTATVRPPSADKAPVSQSPIFNELSSRDERRPLLHKATSSTSVLQLPRRRKEEILIDSQPSSSGSQPLRRPSQGSLGQKTRLQRKLSTVSTRSAKVSKGKSTFGQTVSALLCLPQRAYKLIFASIPALQFCCYLTWFRNACRTVCFCLRRLDWRLHFNNFLRFYYVLYVCPSTFLY